MLIVRCPACHTVFRVRPEQLRAHGGRVRCGSCHGAFNAVEHLMDQARIAGTDAHIEQPEMAPDRVSTPPPTTPRPPPRTPPAPSNPSNPFAQTDTLDFGIPEPRSTTGRSSFSPSPERPPERPEIRPYVPPRPAPPPPDLFAPQGGTAASPKPWRDTPAWSVEPPTEPTPTQPEPVTLPVGDPAPARSRADHDEPAATQPPAHSPAPADTPDTPSPFMVRDEDPPPMAPEFSDDPERVDDPDAPEDDVDDTATYIYRTETPTRHRWLWGLMTGMLAGTLAVQAAYLFREDIARKWPQTRPWYLELCVHLGCTVPLPRVASAITIESSNLETDPRDPTQFILSARVRNQAPHPQQYPHLELTLTDGRDRPVVRRVITPDEWVPGGTQESGILPRTEIEASLPFKATGPVSAVGYRVYAFYP
jgi:predicted Zn finger-like uncharacterized protein